MASFVMLPGAGGAGWYWHLVVAELRARGHYAVAVDLPGADEQAGLPEYAELALAAIGDRSDVVLVAQSLGGFTAPLVCEKTSVQALVLVNAMIPLPGERAGDWWEATGAAAARVEAAVAGGYPTEFDVQSYFFHDVPEYLYREGAEHQQDEAEIVFSQPCTFDAWPDTELHVVSGRDDRFFPIAFQRRIARERLGKDVDELSGGHLISLANPYPLTDRLVAYTTG
jgi:pimeloyl-ACP methyl ester carboxylesterase